MEADGGPYKLFFFCSPYERCKQTAEGMVQAFTDGEVLGVQEEVQLREQDFGNFQDAESKKWEKLERLKFGRVFYRFPHGESSADVYDRITLYQDHLVRDINAGRFGQDCSLSSHTASRPASSCSVGCTGLSTNSSGFGIQTTPS